MVSPHTTLPHHARLVVSRRHLKEMPRNLGGGPSHTSDPRLQLCGPIRDLGPTSGDQGSLSCACEVRRDGSRLWLSGEGKGWSLVEAESHQLQPRTGAEEMTAPVARKAG